MRREEKVTEGMMISSFLFKLNFELLFVDASPFIIIEDALKAAIGLVSEYISSEWSKRLYELFDVPYPTAYVFSS